MLGAERALKLSSGAMLPAFQGNYTLKREALPRNEGKPGTSLVLQDHTHLEEGREKWKKKKRRRKNVC